MNFKPNSTLQNLFVRWGLHPFINYWKASSVVMWDLQHTPSRETSQLEREIICKGGSITADSEWLEHIVI